MRISHSRTIMDAALSKVRSCYRVSILSNPADQKNLIKSKKITKSPGNGIAEPVKSCNLHQKGSFKA